MIMDTLLLDCKGKTDHFCELTVESYVALSLWSFLNGREKIKVKIIEDTSSKNAITVAVNYRELCGEIDFVQHEAEKCTQKLPMFVADNGNYTIIGLCSVLRAICRLMQTSETAGQLATQLLGHKDNCLLATSEVSLWVSFCEREMISCAENLLKTPFRNEDDLLLFPIEMLKLEHEFKNPMRCHNVYKIVRETKKNRSIQSESATKVDLEHKYCHGNEANLSDYVLYVIFKLIFVTVIDDENVFINNLPLVMKWLQNMENEMANLKETTTNLLITCRKIRIRFMEELPCVVPNGKCFSLFKRQLSGQKTKKKARKMLVDQNEIESILAKLKALDFEIKSEPGNVNEQNSLNDSFIEELLTCGELPADRFVRKKHQLKSLAAKVLKIAHDGDIIVDFCSGTGHLGILIAKLLPKCRIIILENKEESIKRASQKSKSLQLTNVSFYQCNLEYFNEKFTVGASLHACGVATDLLLNKCYKMKASFVCSPCCYGKIQDLGNLPQSKIFKDVFSTREFINISHCSDQTHDEKNVKNVNVEKAQQGYFCMDVIDTDRSLRAKELGYDVKLTRLVPEDCTPKNRLLVGLCPNYKILY